MKIYIRSASEIVPFNLETTGTSYYDSFLKEDKLKYMQNSKNLTGEIVWGTPQEYFEECAQMFGQGQSVDDLIDQRSDGSEKKYAEMMRNGTKFDLPYIFKENIAQEGLHRMLAAAQAFGWDCRVPWLEIEPYDMDLYNEAKLAREASDFFDWTLGDYIRKAERKLGDWESPVPENFEETFAHEIEQLAKEEGRKDGHNIEIEVETREHEGHPRFDVYLISYDGYYLPTSSAHDKSPWVEDMFDLDYAESEESNLEDTDLDLLDLDDLFFKK